MIGLQGTAKYPSLETPVRLLRPKRKERYSVPSFTLNALSLKSCRPYVSQVRLAVFLDFTDCKGDCKLRLLCQRKRGFNENCHHQRTYPDLDLNDRSSVDRVTALLYWTCLNRNRHGSFTLGQDLDSPSNRFCVFLRGTYRRSDSRSPLINPYANSSPFLLGYAVGSLALVADSFHMLKYACHSRAVEIPIR